eukprot:symbB.v1.2.017163.t1/scaffold1332.1/size124990/7
MKALLFHVHDWFGISRLLQDIHKVGARSHIEAVRWTCMQMIGEICRAAPIVSIPADGEEGHNDMGDWCECLALLLPRLGNTGCCRYFIEELGMDVNQQDRQGRTALTYAVENEEVDTAVALLRYGASLGLVDAKQRSIYSGCQSGFLKPLRQRLSEWKEEVEMGRNPPKMNGTRGKKRTRDPDPRDSDARTSTLISVENGNPKKRRISRAAGPETLKRWAQQKVPENVIPTGQVLAESADFQILLPNKNLVPHIRALEKDLVLDHAKLFEGELWTQACRPKDWCDGLTLRAAETTAISQIKNTVNQLGQHFALVAVHKETTKVVGYIHGYLDKEKETLFICHLKVFEEFQRRSVGRLLLDGAVKKAMKSKWKMSQIALNVIQRNYPARQFYEKLGFAGRNVKAVASASIDCIQQLLARCEFTANLRVGASEEYLTLKDTSSLLDEMELDFPGVKLTEETEELRGDPAPVSQQLVGSLLQRLPQAMPAMVQHLMLAMHDVDSHAAMTGVDAMHLLLRSCELTPEATGNIVSSIFEEVEKVRHSSVRQLVLSCVKVLAMQHFDTVIEELLETGPDFNMCIMGALQVMAKENTLLLKLLNHFAAILNHSDAGSSADPSGKVLSATVALGHLFTVNDSTMGAAVKKYFSQLFGTFLLRIGTTNEGLSAQQAAGAFMNFLHASQNDSMAMALEGNRLAKVTKEFYDEVICELATLYCRHQPRRRETLLHFFQPFLAAPAEGHRVAAITSMSQILSSCIDNPMDQELVHSTLCCVLAAIEDPDQTVRKQAVRGLGNVANLWQGMPWEDLSHLTTQETIQEVLQQMCRLLSDEDRGSN